jgi:tetratricopeptide (TPR) repeat protein
MMRRVVALVITLMLGLGSTWAENTAAPTPSGGAPVIVGVNELLSAGRIDDALKALNVRLKSAPHDAQAYNLLSRSYFAVQNWDQAIAAGEKAVSIEPNNSAYHMWLGRAYGEKASHSSFVTAAQLTKRIRMEFERAVELNAMNLDARSDLAEFYVEAPAFLGGGKGKAKRQAEAIAQQDKALAHWLQARIADKDKRYEEAEAEYRKAIQESGNQGSYWLNLATFYKQHQRLSEMESAIGSAIEADKKRPTVLFDAAQILFAAGRNFVGAANFVRRYLVNGPTVEEAPAFQAHHLLGEILEKQGDKAGAAAEYKAALALAKDYDQAREALNRLTQK